MTKIVKDRLIDGLNSIVDTLQRKCPISTESDTVLFNIHALHGIIMQLDLLRLIVEDEDVAGEESENVPG